MRVLITGHNGFKGSWLSLILQSQGHEIYGISLPAISNSLYVSAGIEGKVQKSYSVDICDKKLFAETLKKIQPEVIIHLAAQSLVPYSHKNIYETYNTNIMGTVNLMESLNALDNLKACLVVTTDKVYQNVDNHTAYAENDSLGCLTDPYSVSKAAADLITQSFTVTHPEMPIAIARAGNVIGGGDWADGRLIPDWARAYESNLELRIRNLGAIRPWQHVLDCLNGYLALIEALMLNKVEGGAWNFGPPKNNEKNVQDLINVLNANCGTPVKLEHSEAQISEASYLSLDSSKAKLILGWENKWNFETAVLSSMRWYIDSIKGASPLLLMERDMTSFGAFHSFGSFAQRSREV